MNNENNLNNLGDNNIESLGNNSNNSLNNNVTVNQNDNLNNNLNANSNVSLNNTPESLNTNPNIDNSLNNLDNNHLEANIDNGSKKKKITLVLLGILIVVILVVGIIFGLKLKNNSENIYYKVINNVSDYLLSTHKELKIDDLFSNDTTLSFNLTTTNNDYKDIAKIINKFKINTISNVDYKNKKMNVNLNLLYNTNNIINANLYLDNSNLYANVKDVYDKTIRVLDKGLEGIWEYKDDSNEILIKEFSKILKRNLKEEYFTKTNEKIVVLGKEASVVNHTLTLDSESLTELKTNILKDIMNDDKLVSEIATLSSQTKDEVKENINDAVDNLSSNGNLVINTYVEKNNIVRVAIKIDDNTLMFNKDSEESYAIVLNNTSIGTMEVKEESVNIDINYDGVQLSLGLNKDNVKIKFSSEGNTISATITRNNDKINGSIELDIPTEKINLVVNIASQSKSIDKFAEFNVSDAVKLESLTDEELGKMVGNLLQNQTLLTLIEDLGVLD